MLINELIQTNSLINIGDFITIKSQYPIYPNKTNILGYYLTTRDIIDFDTYIDGFYCIVLESEIATISENSINWLSLNKNNEGVDENFLNDCNSQIEPYYLYFKFVKTSNSEQIINIDKLSLQISDVLSSDNYPYYDSSIFKDKRLYDEEILNWTNGALDKLKGIGIIPTFVQKDKDFSVFWGWICHIYAILVVYTRQFLNIFKDKSLFREFLKQKDVYFDSRVDLYENLNIYGNQQLYYEPIFNKKIINGYPTDFIGVDKKYICSKLVPIKEGNNLHIKPFIENDNLPDDFNLDVNVAFYNDKKQFIQGGIFPLSKEFFEEQTKPSYRYIFSHISTYLSQTKNIIRLKSIRGGRVYDNGYYKFKIWIQLTDNVQTGDIVQIIVKYVKNIPSYSIFSEIYQKTCIFQAGEGATEKEFDISDSPNLGSVGGCTIIAYNIANSSDLYYLEGQNDVYLLDKQCPDIATDNESIRVWSGVKISNSNVETHYFNPICTSLNTVSSRTIGVIGGDGNDTLKVINYSFTNENPNNLVTEEFWGGFIKVTTKYHGKTLETIFPFSDTVSLNNGQLTFNSYYDPNFKEVFGEEDFVCNTGASDANKIVNGSFALQNGSLINYGHVFIKMNHANTTDNPTLNINGTGAKTLLYSNNNHWDYGDILDVQYNGTYYVATKANIENRNIVFDTGKLSFLLRYLSSGNSYKYYANWKGREDYQSGVYKYSSVPSGTQISYNVYNPNPCGVLTNVFYWDLSCTNKLMGWFQYALGGEMRRYVREGEYGGTTLIPSDLKNISLNDLEDYILPYDTLKFKIDENNAEQDIKIRFKKPGSDNYYSTIPVILTGTSEVELVFGTDVIPIEDVTTSFYNNCEIYQINDENKKNDGAYLYYINNEELPILDNPILTSTIGKVKIKGCYENIIYVEENKKISYVAISYPLIYSQELQETFFVKLSTYGKGFYQVNQLSKRDCLDIANIFQKRGTEYTKESIKKLCESTINDSFYSNYLNKKNIGWILNKNCPITTSLKEPIKVKEFIISKLTPLVESELVEFNDSFIYFSDFNNLRIKWDNLITQENTFKVKKVTIFCTLYEKKNIFEPINSEDVIIGEFNENEEPQNDGKIIIDNIPYYLNEIIIPLICIEDIRYKGLYKNIIKLNWGDIYLFMRNYIDDKNVSHKLEYLKIKAIHFESYQAKPFLSDEITYIKFGVSESPYQKYFDTEYTPTEDTRVELAVIPSVDNSQLNGNYLHEIVAGYGGKVKSDDIANSVENFDKIWRLSFDSTGLFNSFSNRKISNAVNFDSTLVNTIKIGNILNQSVSDFGIAWIRIYENDILQKEYTPKIKNGVVGFIDQNNNFKTSVNGTLEYIISEREKVLAQSLNKKFIGYYFEPIENCKKITLQNRGCSFDEVHFTLYYKDINSNNLKIINVDKVFTKLEKEAGYNKIVLIDNDNITYLGIIIYSLKGILSEESDAEYEILNPFEHKREFFFERSGKYDYSSSNADAQIDYGDAYSYYFSEDILDFGNSTSNLVCLIKQNSIAINRTLSNVISVTQITNDSSSYNYKINVQFEDSGTIYFAAIYVNSYSFDSITYTLTYNSIYSIELVLNDCEYNDGNWIRWYSKLNVDFNLRRLPYNLGFLNFFDYYFTYYKNNSKFSDEEINEIISQKFLPYRGFRLFIDSDNTKDLIPLKPLQLINCEVQNPKNFNVTNGDIILKWKGGVNPFSIKLKNNYTGENIYFIEKESLTQDRILSNVFYVGIIIGNYSPYTKINVKYWINDEEILYSIDILVYSYSYDFASKVLTYNSEYCIKNELKDIYNFERTLQGISCYKKDGSFELTNYTLSLVDNLGEHFVNNVNSIILNDISIALMQNVTFNYQIFVVPGDKDIVDNQNNLGNYDKLKISIKGGIPPYKVTYRGFDLSENGQVIKDIDYTLYQNGPNLNNGNSLLENWRKIWIDDNEYIEIPNILLERNKNFYILIEDNFGNKNYILENDKIIVMNSDLYKIIIKEDKYYNLYNSEGENLLRN